MPRSLIFFFDILLTVLTVFPCSLNHKNWMSYKSECNKQLPENHLCNNYQSDLILMFLVMSLLTQILKEVNCRSADFPPVNTIIIAVLLLCNNNTEETTTRLTNLLQGGFCFWSKVGKMATQRCKKDRSITEDCSNVAYSFIFSSWRSAFRIIGASGCQA